MRGMRQRLVINEVSLLTVIDGLVIPPGYGSTCINTYRHTIRRVRYDAI